MQTTFTVNHHTPTESEIETAQEAMKIYDLFPANFYSMIHSWYDRLSHQETDLIHDDIPMTIIDFSHLYSEEEKRAHLNVLVPNFEPINKNGTYAVEFTGLVEFNNPAAKRLAEKMLTRMNENGSQLKSIPFLVKEGIPITKDAKAVISESSVSYLSRFKI